VACRTGKGTTVGTIPAPAADIGSPEAAAVPVHAEVEALTHQIQTSVFRTLERTMILQVVLYSFGICSSQVEDRGPNFASCVLRFLLEHTVYWT
jgi:hypothetical protein